MADIINLRQARKAATRAKAEAAAAENRRRFGRTKAEKAAEAGEAKRAAALLEGARREDPKG